jgi:hypothetical protein
VDGPKSYRGTFQSATLLYPTGSFHFKTSVAHFSFLNSFIQKNLTSCLFKVDEISYVCHSRNSRKEIQDVREYWTHLGRITNEVEFQFSLINLNCVSEIEFLIYLVPFLITTFSCIMRLRIFKITLTQIYKLAPVYAMK